MALFNALQDFIRSLRGQFVRPSGSYRLPERQFQSLSVAKLDFCSRIDAQISDALNVNWSKASGTNNILIQHGHESLFSLNEINDIYKAFEPGGTHPSTFDLRLENPGGATNFGPVELG